MKETIKNKIIVTLIATFLLFTIAFAGTISNLKQVKANSSAQSEGVYGQEDFYFQEGVMLSAENLGAMYFRLMVNADVFENHPDATVIITHGQDIFGEEYSLELSIESEWLEANVGGTDYLFYDIESEAQTYTKIISATAYLWYTDNDVEYSIATMALPRSYVQALRTLEEKYGEDGLHTYFGYDDEYQFVKQLLRADSSGFITLVLDGHFFTLVPNSEDVRYMGNLIFKLPFVSTVSETQEINFYQNGSSATKLTFTINANGTITVQDTTVGLFDDGYVNYDYYCGSTSRVISWRYIRFSFLNDLPDDCVLTSDMYAYNDEYLAMLLTEESDYTNGLLEEIEYWKGEYQKISDMVTQKEQQINDYKSQLSNLQKTYETVVAEREVLMERKATLEKDIESKTAEINELRGVISNLTSTNAQYAADLENKERELEELQAAYDALVSASDGDLAVINLRLQELRTQIAQKDNQIKELTKEKEKLEAEIEELKNKQGTLSLGCSGGNFGGFGGSVGDGMAITGAALFGGFLFMVWRNYARKKKIVQ